ncbi:MAG: hypothetical protein J7J94_02160 [Thaumarchaeota archaeon]|nr:hypothetical protein [Nitrososphaerota archaeon]
MKTAMKPPIAIEVQDLLNLSRLAMSRADVRPLFWEFPYRRKRIIGSLVSVPYWRGSLPIFAYAKLKRDEIPKGYVGYTNIGFEKVILTESPDDTRYFYGPVVEMDDPPKFLGKALSAKSGLREKPVTVRARSLESLVRVSMIMSDNVSSPPLWHYRLGRSRHILGLLTPFYDYYEANALPVFFYVETTREPGPFIKYQASDGKEELSYAANVSDMKYFYCRVVTVKEMPFLALRRRGRRKS